MPSSQSLLTQRTTGCFHSRRRPRTMICNIAGPVLPSKIFKPSMQLSFWFKHTFCLKSLNLTFTLILFCGWWLHRPCDIVCSLQTASDIDHLKFLSINWAGIYSLQENTGISRQIHTRLFEQRILDYWLLMQAEVYNV
jgi:hypothetical protein